MDYFNKRGEILHAWMVHKKKMKEAGLPYVGYNSFYTRMKKWNLYGAIHTPLDYRKVPFFKRVPIYIRTQWFRFIYLFKRHDRRGGKGHSYPC